MEIIITSQFYPNAQQNGGHKTGLTDIYLKKISDEYELLGAWTPDINLKLGDIGRFDGKKFIPVSNLRYEPFLIDFEEEQDPTPSDIKIVTEGGVSINLKNSGSPTPLGCSFADIDAGLILDFTADNSFYLYLFDVKKHTIKNQLDIEQKILDLYKNKKWDENYGIITKLCIAKSGTIILSKKKGAKVEIKLKGNVSLSEIEIAKAESISGFNSNNIVGLNIIARKGLTPLFEAIKVKDSWFSKDEMIPARLSYIRSQIRSGSNINYELNNRSQEIPTEEVKPSMESVSFKNLDEEGL